MIQITCEICMDLIPLVQDGVAAGDSVSAVEQHIQSCPQCRAMWEGQIPHSADSGPDPGEGPAQDPCFYGDGADVWDILRAEPDRRQRAVSEQPYHACDRLHRLLPVPLEIPVSYPVPSLCHPSGHKCSQNVPWGRSIWTWPPSCCGPRCTRSL